jgi:Rrf2 family protein
MRVSAKADYAVRAAVELASQHGAGPVKGERLGEAQGIPVNFLENILGDLRQAGLVRSQRGPDGGYWLARDPTEVTVADVMRAVEGPLAAVRGERPEQLEYIGAAEGLQRVWIALRTNIRGVLEQVTLAEIAGDALPSAVDALAREPDSWTTR